MFDLDVVQVWVVPISSCVSSISRCVHTPYVHTGLIHASFKPKFDGLATSELLQVSLKPTFPIESLVLQGRI